MASKGTCISISGWQAAEVWTILGMEQYRTHMPTVLRIGPYRFFFYSGDRNEPQHVHVERDDKVAKFWLDPVRLQINGDFSGSETNRIESLVEENREILAGSWNDFFNR
jgi:hypothetical protein